jgi:hypothetical protein
MVLFAGIMAALALGATLLRPRFAVLDSTAPLVALWLLALIALASAAATGRPGSLIDYKIALPILALLLAPNLKAVMGGLDLGRFVLGSGALYVLSTVVIVLALPSTAVLRNVAAHVRVDVTGSVVLHAALCTIIALATAAALIRQGRISHRILCLLVLAAASWMVVLTGTRSALLALACFVALWAAAGRPGDLVRPG